ncbi:MAG: SH3 domain-containing protein [Flavonifractor plautii]
MEVVVSAPLCPLYAAASAGAERSDELLCGWTAELLEEFSTGWCRVRTKYRYEGWARREHLRPAGDWTGRTSGSSAPRLPTCWPGRRWRAPCWTPCPGALAAPSGRPGRAGEIASRTAGRAIQSVVSGRMITKRHPPCRGGPAGRAVEVALSPGHPVPLGR